MEIYKPYPRDTRYLISNIGNVISPYRRNPLKLHTPHNAYPRTSMLGTCMDVHVLVLETFIGPRPKGMWARHLNSIKTDNRLCNLCWDTPSANLRDRNKHGVMFSKLSIEQVQDIKRKLSLGHQTQTAIAKEYNVTAPTISSINVGKTHKHVEV